MSARLDKILSRFKSTAAELEKLAQQAEAEILAHDTEIANRTLHRNNLSAEKMQALGVANKIKDLIAA